MAPPNSSSFSVSVVLPASGCEMIANVRRRPTSRARSVAAVSMGNRRRWGRHRQKQTPPGQARRRVRDYTWAGGPERSGGEPDVEARRKLAARLAWLQHQLAATVAEEVIVVV